MERNWITYERLLDMAADGGAAVVSYKILFQTNAGIYGIPSV